MSERRPQTEAELVEFLRSVDVRAPQELHDRIQVLVDERSPRGLRRPPRVRASSRAPSLGWRLGVGIAALAAAAVALVIGLTGGGSGALNVRQASASTLRPATMAPPAQSPSGRAQLAAAVEGVTFPYWEDRFGWRSTGARVDRVGGRAVTTVFYANDRGQRIGYAIFAGSPAPHISGVGGVVWRHGTPYRLSSNGHLEIVTWLRNGHLCVVAGRSLKGATLLRLASWEGRSTVA
jgi:hypothetical protein